MLNLVGTMKENERTKEEQKRASLLQNPLTVSQKAQIGLVMEVKNNFLLYLHSFHFLQN